MKHSLLLLLASASPALAHPGDHTTTGPAHFLTEPDHLALIALALVVVVGVVIKRRSRR
ncbi:hypothetical protein [Rhodobacter sp. SY28-1]|uniref:hypothetical protein n=1 Tax=Rhodobacter sp. SY28-1 TaxID=2562317 RepID=UPI00148580FD|nr:hypothetical protein [Rhodobacter sp. SY28-1]